MKKIYVVGSMAYDRIMDFPGKFVDFILPDKIHILNVCFTVNGMQERFGGTAGNIAYSLCLLGEGPVIVASIGRDHAPYFKWLADHGLDTSGINVTEKELTAGAYIITDRSDNQITGFNPGAMKSTSGKDELISSGGVEALGIIAAGNLPDMMNYARLFKGLGIPCICDPGQSLPSWDAADLRTWVDGSWMLICNDYEMELIGHMLGMEEGDLLGLTSMMVKTLGEKGSIVTTTEGSLFIPPLKVENVVDPTGAGDAFRSGLIKGIVTGRPMEISARMGSVAAAYAIEHYGTQGHQYTLEEFIERYTQNFGPWE